MKTCTTSTILLAAAALLSPSLALDGRDLEALVNRNREPTAESESATNVVLGTKIRMDEPAHFFDASRSLQAEARLDESAQCYTTSGKSPSTYCTVDDTPREGTFLILTCLTTTDDYSKCVCEVGIGNPEDAPGTPTCTQCNFCKDQSLAYDCRNVAEGSCIGLNCEGECISDTEVEEDLKLTDTSDGGNEKDLELTDTSDGGNTDANLNLRTLFGIVALASSLVVWLV
jgi:hypothetical protein